MSTDGVEPADDSLQAKVDPKRKQISFGKTALVALIAAVVVFGFLPWVGLYFLTLLLHVASN